MIHTCTLWPHRIISIINEQHTFLEKISFPAASEFDNNLVLTFWRSSIYRSRYTYSRNYILRHVHGTGFVFFFFIWLGVLLIGAVINHGKLVLRTLHFYHASRNHSYSLLSRISASVEMFSHSLRICIGGREKKRNKIGERIRKGNDYDNVRWSNPEYHLCTKSFTKFLEFLYVTGFTYGRHSRYNLHGSTERLSQTVRLRSIKHVRWILNISLIVRYEFELQNFALLFTYALICK